MRRSESTKPRNTAIYEPDDTLDSRRYGTFGYRWHPIATLSDDDVLAIHEQHGFPRHPAYTEFGSSRLSCSFCVLASLSDHLAALRCAGNQSAYGRLIALEMDSAFSFQPGAWLVERSPELAMGFGFDERAIRQAQDRARRRRAAEASLPKNLLFADGWPSEVPSLAEARLIATMRREVGALQGIAVLYTDAEEIQARFAQLLTERDAFLARKTARGGQSRARAAAPPAKAAIQLSMTPMLADV